MRYDLHDALGNVVAQASLDGDEPQVVWAAQYDAHGKKLAETSETPSPYQWGGAHGYYADEDVGMYLLGLRWYESFTGRFINQDPIGFGGNDANLYRYVGNDPINAVDPWGLQRNNNRALREQQMARMRGEIARHRNYILWFDFDAQEYAALEKGFAATMDGLIPGVDPFESLYDKNDPLLQKSHQLGQVAFIALSTATGRALFDAFGKALTTANGINWASLSRVEQIALSYGALLTVIYNSGKIIGPLTATSIGLAGGGLFLNKVKNFIHLMYKIMTEPVSNSK
jgi:RHS repeat-associated protein